MDVVVTGATGLIGTALKGALGKTGHRIVPMVRSQPSGDAIHWDPDRGEIDAADGRRHAGQAEVALDRSVVAEALLDEARDEVAVRAQPRLQRGVVAQHHEGGPEQADRRLLAGREHVGGDPRHVDRFG